MSARARDVISQAPRADAKQPAGATRPGRHFAARWTSFLLASGILWIVLFILIPAAQRLPGQAQDVERIIDSGIEAGAIFYTDVEKVREAESFVRGVRNGEKTDRVLKIKQD